MKKLSFLTIFSGIMIATSAFAQCDADNAKNSSVIPVWDSNTGRNTGEYHFYFQRDCDKTDSSCSHLVNVLVTTDGNIATYPMRWVVEPTTNLHSWYAEKFIQGKKLSYQVQYQDESGKFCITSSKRF